MPRDHVECAEVVGKIIKTLNVYEDDVDGCETLIEFTDGTSFSCCVCNEPKAKAVLFKGGIGTPEIIRDYKV